MVYKIVTFCNYFMVDRLLTTVFCSSLWDNNLRHPIQSKPGGIRGGMGAGGWEGGGIILEWNVSIGRLFLRLL